MRLVPFADPGGSQAQGHPGALSGGQCLWLHGALGSGWCWGGVSTLAPHSTAGACGRPPPMPCGTRAHPADVYAARPKAAAEVWRADLGRHARVQPQGACATCDSTPSRGQALRVTAVGPAGFLQGPWATAPPPAPELGRGHRCAHCCWLLWLCGTASVTRPFARACVRHAGSALCLLHDSPQATHRCQTPAVSLSPVLHARCSRLSSDTSPPLRDTSAPPPSAPAVKNPASASLAAGNLPGAFLFCPLARLSAHNSRH